MKKRISIITDLMDRCICNNEDCNGPIEIHEAIFGSKKQTSIRYGLVVPLCANHHRGTCGVHGSKGHALDMELKRKAQLAFEKKFPDLEFLKIFGRNYL